MSIATVGGATVFLVVGFLLGCQESAAPPGAGARYRGPVVRLAEPGPGALLQYRPSGATTGQIWIGFTPATPMRFSSGAVAEISNIRVGSVLAVWSTSGVAESDPAQTGADSILILRP